MRIAFISTNQGFCGSILEELQRHHTVRNYKPTKSEIINWVNLQRLLNWCDLAYFDFIQPPMPEITQLQSVDVPIVARMDGIDILMHTLIDWRKVNALILMPVQRKRLMRLRRMWALQNPGERLTNLPTKILERNVGIDLSLFQPDYIRSPGYNIVIHASTVRPTKRIYTAIQCFYDLITRDPDKPWKLILLGNYTFHPYDEYLMAIEELIEEYDLPEERLAIITQDFPRDEWAAFIKKQDIYWCMSFREGFPNSLGESCASGVYPVVNRFYGAELLYPEKYLCKTLSEVVEKTIQWGNLTPEEKIGMRKEVRQHIEIFDRHEVAVEIRELCEEVLEEWNAKSA